MTTSLLRGWITAASLLAGGCDGGQSPGLTHDVDASTPAADAGADPRDASPCARGSHATGLGCEASLTGWGEQSSLPEARDHHVTFVLGTAAPKLYVVGGIGPAGPTAQSYVAPLDPRTGVVGAFEAATALPMPLAGAGLAVSSRAVVVVGGSDAAGYTTSVFVAQISADGALGTWSAGPPLAAASFHGAAVARGDVVYAVGGLVTTTDGSINGSTSVARAALSADGRLGEWVQTTPLPGERSHHALLVHEGALYVVGGASIHAHGTDASASYLREILRGTLDESGNVTHWTTVSTLPAGMRAHAAFEHDGHLYVAGGLSPREAHLALVRRAPFLADGTLGEWEELDAGRLPDARAHVHQAPTLGPFVYFVGGTDDADEGRTTVWQGTFE